MRRIEMFKHVLTALSMAALAVAKVDLLGPIRIEGRPVSMDPFGVRHVRRSSWRGGGKRYPQHGKRECARRRRQMGLE